MLRDELRPVIAGVVLGVCAALATAPCLGALLFATSPTDASTYSMAAGGLLAVAVLASYLPARQAGKSDPADLLRV